MNIDNKQLASLLSRHWRALLLRGLLAIIWGVLIWLQPEISLAVLLVLFGAYVLVDGLVGVWMAVRGRKDYEDWWILLLWGLVGISIGLLTLMKPGVTSIALVFYIAIWAIAIGLLQIVLAVRLRRELVGEWLLILSGLTAAVCGGILMANPSAGALTLLWLIGAFAVLFGVLHVALALGVRKFVADEVLPHIKAHDKRSQAALNMPPIASTITEG